MSASANPTPRRASLPPLDLRGGVPFGQTVLLAARSALVALGAHRLRAALTIVGIVVGIAGVFTIINLATLARNQTVQGFGNLGANVIDISGFSVSSSAAPQPGTGSHAVALIASGAPSLTAADVQALRQLSHVVGVSPMLPAQAQVQAGDHNWTTQVFGTYPDAQIMGGYQVQQGAFFSQDDVTADRTVAVLGQTVAQQLFPGGNALGQTVRISSVDFSVVGVLAPNGANGNRDLDDVVFVPASTVLQRLLGSSQGERMQVGKPPPGGGPPPGVQVIQAQGIQNPALMRSNFPDVQVAVDDPSNVDSAKTAITHTLEQDHGIQAGSKDDFTVGGFLPGVKAAQQSTATLLWGMGAVAAVALLIGGFGVANVMLATVAERRREIGVRLAVGATAEDVSLQFLLEALALAVVGGVLGIIVGVALTLGLPLLFGQPDRVNVAPSGLAVAVALGATVALGLIFGAYPARRAAQTDPIDVLRRA